MTVANGEKTTQQIVKGSNFGGVESHPYVRSSLKGLIATGTSDKVEIGHAVVQRPVRIPRRQLFSSPQATPTIVHLLEQLASERSRAIPIGKPTPIHFTGTTRTGSELVSFVVDALNEEDRARLHEDILLLSAEALGSGDLSGLLLAWSGWEATAELERDPTAKKAFLEALAEVETEPWDKVKRDLLGE